MGDAVFPLQKSWSAIHSNQVFSPVLDTLAAFFRRILCGCPKNPMLCLFFLSVYLGFFALAFTFAQYVSHQKYALAFTLAHFSPEICLSFLTGVCFFGDKTLFYQYDLLHLGQVNFQLLLKRNTRKYIFNHFYRALSVMSHAAALLFNTCCVHFG